MTTSPAPSAERHSTLGQDALGRLADVVQAVTAFAHYRVDWFDRWHSDLDSALRGPPELETCPPDLYRELVEIGGPLERRTALVTRRGLPVAVIGLRREPPYWKPVTTWVLPGAPFPVQPGAILPALAALRLRVLVAWWRQETPPPVGSPVATVESLPTHRLTCGNGFEEYWKGSGLTRHLKKARERCAHMRIAVNLPGATEWAIQQWARKWAASGHHELPDVADRLAVARYWTPRGRHFTLSLLDGDRLVARDLTFAHRNEIVGMLHYRDPGYDECSPGTRLLEGVHRWASEAGYSKHDFGGGHEYKRRWAPQEGIRWHFTIPATLRSLGRMSRDALRRLRGGALALPRLECLGPDFLGASCEWVCLLGH